MLLLNAHTFCVTNYICTYKDIQKTDKSISSKEKYGRLGTRSKKLLPYTF